MTSYWDSTVITFQSKISNKPVNSSTTKPRKAMAADERSALLKSLANNSRNPQRKIYLAQKLLHQTMVAARSINTNTAIAFSSSRNNSSQAIREIEMPTKATRLVFTLLRYHKHVVLKLILIVAEIYVPMRTITKRFIFRGAAAAQGIFAFRGALAPTGIYQFHTPDDHVGTVFRDQDRWLIISSVVAVGVHRVTQRT